MGFLEFKDKIKSLEMFLTDKGKERMLRENGLGLSELIQRFTFYDDDWDYRRTSQYWQDGVSPQPQNTTTPGSTQTLTNDLGLAVISNLQEHFVTPLTATTEWFDMTDVRGHRGRPILDCHPVTGDSSMLSCTNIYAFYDVTSVAEVAAIACKDGIEAWALNYRNIVNTGWTGSVFHLPVYGERWLNSAYYPWHGELDTCSYNIGDFTAVGSPNGTNYLRFAGLGGQNTSTGVPNGVNGVPVNGEGMLTSNTTFEGGASSTGQPFSINPAQDDGTASGPHIYGVTGMWNGTLVNGDYAINFGVYPPGTTTDITSDLGLRGSKMEWFVTGCTLNYNTYHSTPYPIYWNLGGEWNNHTVTLEEPEVSSTSNFSGLVNISYTATPYSTTFSATDLAGTSLDEAWSYPQFDTEFIYSGLTKAIYDQTPQVVNIDVLCEQNCCSDDYRDTGSLFGCNECGNPFDNIVEHSSGTTIGLNPNQPGAGPDPSGYWMGISDPHHALSASPLTVIAITGLTTMWGYTSWYPCETFKGGDRNVLVISTTDEAQVGTNGNSLGGIMPLGVKNYYGKGAVTIGAPDTSTISTWCGDVTVPANNNACGTLNKGYHGGGTTVAGNSAFMPNLAHRMGWDLSGTKSYGDHTGIPYAAAGQPTPDWQYCQDLFLRTRVFYDSFRGFAYPAVARNSLTYSHFLQHTYGAIMGTTVPLSGLSTPNPTIYGDAGTPKSLPTHPLVALTGANPYNEIIPVTYTRPAVPYGPTITPAWGNDGSAGCAGQMTETIDINGNPTCVESVESTWDNVCSKSGLRWAGWGANTSVGCVYSTTATPCTGPDFFTGTNFQTDLTDFITGNTTVYIGYECTYCQCLPAVFINRIGPPDPTIVNPCPNPPCGPPVNPPTVDEIGCGPLPLLSSQVRMSTYGSVLGGGTSNNGMANSASNSLFSSRVSNGSQEVSSMNSLQMLDNVGGAGNWGEMQRDLSTTTNRNARTGLVVDMSAILQPFSYQYNDETYIDYDIIFNSETQIGNTKVVKGQVKFKWIIEPGLIPTKRPGHKPQLSKCRKVEVSEVNKKVIGGDLEPFIYLNGIRTKEEGRHWKYQEDEYCVTLAVEIDGKMQIKTKRIRIVGNKFNGWTINWLST